MTYCPTVSVIMPAYNSEKYIDSAISSIINQSYIDFEFLIFDDGSSDGTLQIARKWEAKDSRIKVFSRENKGLVCTLNELLGHVKGKYVARMDSDDISLPPRLKNQVKALDEGCDIVGCHYFHIDNTGKIISSTIVPLTKESFLVKMSLSSPFAHGSVMFKRDFIESKGLNYSRSNAVNAEDYALWISMFDHGAVFGNCDDALFCYREYPSSLSRTNYASLCKDSHALSKKFILDNRDSIYNAMNKMCGINLSDSEWRSLSTLLFIYLSTSKRFGVMKSIRFIRKRYLLEGFFRFVTKRYY